MEPISFKRHRFPPEVIQHAVWLDFRFTLSNHDGQTGLLWRGAAQTWPGRASSLQRTTIKQSGGKQSSADQATGAKDAEVQARRLSPAPALRILRAWAHAAWADATKTA
jgi:hypothetical protein